MASNLKYLLSDVTTYEVVTTAVATAAYASYRANESLLKTRNRSSQRDAPSLSDQLIDENARTLEGSMALAFPIIATCSIVFLFFFLKHVGMILTALTAFSGLIAVIFLLWPLAEFCVRRIRKAGIAVRSTGQFEVLLLCPIAVLIIGFWLFTGHWIPNNIIGIALCILFACLCKVPSLKVCSMLFAGLFAYDIFFVFFSARFFGRNVMVEVATSTPTNPAAAVASFLHLPISPVQNLALPGKLVFPAGNDHDSILGLGDIILPCILLVYLLEFDIRNHVPRLYWGYCGRALFAYVIGLLTSFYFSFTFRTAQPALLYIVPCMLLPTLIHAHNRGQLVLMWKGPTPAERAVFVDDAMTEGSVTGPKDQEDAALIPQVL